MSDPNVKTMKLTLGTAKRSLEEHLSAIINVKDYGAVGNGSTDDAAAIQAALDASFGTAGAPHGNGGRNRAVYFPAGSYRLLTPLVVTDVWGGHIFGDGKLATTVFFDGTISAVNGEGWCPTLWLNGFSYGTIENMTFSGPSDASGHSTVCLWFGPDGVSGRTNAHSNTIIAVGAGDTSYGVIHGSDNGSAVSETMYIGCTLNAHEQVGLLISGANTLNIRYYGGDISDCGVAGIKAVGTATIPIISSVAFAGNFVDVDLSASSYCSMDGNRTESTSFVKASSNVTMRSCVQSTTGGTITASTSGTTLTVTALSGGGLTLRPGMVIYGSQGGNSLPLDPPTRITSLGSGSGGTGTYTISAAGSPGNLSSTTLTVRPVFLEQVSQSNVDMTSCDCSTDTVLISPSSSQLRIRNNSFFDQNNGIVSADLFKFYQGQVFEYDVACLNAFTVANLPTASSIFKGCRMFVNNSSVAASGNFAAIVAGGGSNTVPIFCDGTNWRIG